MEPVEFFDLKDDGFFDERGWAVNPIPVEKLTKKEFGHLHIASLIPGVVRGNHYHEQTTEFLYVFGGGYEFYYISDGTIKKRIFNNSELFGIRINAGTAHAIKNTGETIIFVAAYYDMLYNFEDPDTVKKILI
jgi:dTDP-4-dehydrorhamnose 3,5-epimerase-like enzyme